MIKKLTGLLFLTSLSFTVLCQTSEARRGRPDLPGTFTVEIGLNRGLEAPANFSLGLWGSRTVNIYYQYEMRILKSKFSFVPGIGLSLERFKFKNGHTLGYPTNTTDSILLNPISQSGIVGLKKSHLVTNFIEIPLEIRFTTNPNDLARSFKISLGGRIGYLYDAFSKIKYKENGEVKRFKDKQNFNVNDLRYGVYSKIGVGNFSVFGYYNLTPLFKEGKGLYENRTANNFNTFTVGISFSSF